MSVDRKTRPEARPFAPLTMPAETVERLGNGVTFHRYRGGDQPMSRLTIHLAGGSAEFGEATSKLLVNQLTEGTSTLSADDIAEALDFNGARLATQTQTHFSVVDLTVLSSRLDDTLPLLRDIIVDSVYPEDRLEVFKFRLKNAIAVMRGDPSALAEQGLLPLILGGDNPMARALGPDDVDAVDRETLLACHRRLLCPGRIHAYLSGRFDDSRLDAVRRFLESMPAVTGGIDRAVYPAAPAPAGTIHRDDSLATKQSAIVCGIPSVTRSHPDYIPLRFAVMALGGYFGSRLMSNIREEKGLTYGINAALMGDLDQAHVHIATRTDRRNTDRVIDEIRRELTSLADNPPAADELERFRTYAMAGLAELLDNPASVMQHYASQNLVGTPADYFERQQSVLRKLTPQEISRVSRLYLNPGEMRISIV